MAEPALADKVVLVHDALDRAGVDHAFGGAIALAYYAEPRATIDIDLFVAPDAYPGVVLLLRDLGVDRFATEEDVLRDGQGRLWWGRTPLDLFFAYDAVHEAMRDGCRAVPFGDTTIPVLAPEHLLVAKAIFDRPKDWLDIEQVLLATPGLDADEIDRWLDHLAGAHDARATRMRVLRERLLGEPWDG